VRGHLHIVTGVAGLLGLLLVSVSVGLSNFAGAIGIGIGGIDARTRLRVGLAFGLFEALMPVAGLLLGNAVAGYFGHIARYLGGAILVLTGAYTIWQGRRTAAMESAGHRLPPGLRTHQLIVTALALSIDNLAVGFAIAIYHVDLLLAAALMGVVSVAMSLVGLELGNRLGERVEAWSEEIGGAVLIGVGGALAAGWLA
jgi:manganese efflux pump family protein